MTPVNIANLKARLSYYLSEVKRGHGIVVMDRSTPVARLEPIRGDGPKLAVRKARKDARELRRLRIPPLERPLRADVVALLREDRAGR